VFVFFNKKCNKRYSISIILGNSLQEIANGVELSVEPVKYHLEALKRDGIVKDAGSSSGQPVYAIEFNVVREN
jgi:DNA-binding Lrp family transcriptional regulator